MKKNSIVFCAVAFALCVTHARDAQEYIALREQVKAWRTELVHEGAYAFVTNHETTPRTAPHIRSQCWVDWLPRTNVEQIAYEQEKRDFGMDFVDELEKLALAEIPIEDADAHERRAERALAIATWLRTAEGYGNQLLKRWCEGIASSSLGSMAVNAQCDTNRVLKLITKVDGLHVNLVRQVAILNEESPHRYTVPNCTTDVEASDNLERQWLPHQQAAWRYFHGKRKDGNRIFVFNQVKDGPFEYVFYLPDRPDRTGNADPVKEVWRSKEHDAVCIYACDESMVNQIHQILRWRTFVGELPRPTGAEISDSNLGFLYCSRMYDLWRGVTKGKEDKFLGAYAVLKIYGNEFVDWNTRHLQLYRERKNRK